MAVNPSPLPGVQPHTPSLSLSTQPSLFMGMKAVSWLEVLLGSDLCSEFSPFCLPSTCCCVTLWGFVVPPWPRLWWWGWGFWVCRNISSFKTPAPGCKCPSQNPLSTFFFFIFSPASFWGDWLLFLEVWHLLPVFRRCSVGVFDDICGFEGDLPILVLRHLVSLYVTF